MIEDEIEPEAGNDTFVKPLKNVDPDDQHSKAVLEALYDQIVVKRKRTTGRQLLASILWGVNGVKRMDGGPSAPPRRFFMEQGQATLDIRRYPNVKDSNSVRKMLGALVEKEWLQPPEAGNFNQGEAHVFTAPEGSPLIVGDLKFVDVPYEKPLVMVGHKNRTAGYGAEYRTTDIRFMTQEEVRTKIGSVFTPEMKALNDRVQSHSYSLSDSANPAMPLLDNADCRLTRRFVGGLENHGGRLSAKYMKFSSDRRSHILIDGEPTIEIDVVSCGIRLLAAVLGKAVPDHDDLYEVVDHPMPRKDKKRLITALSNHGKLNKRRWPRNWHSDSKLGPIIECWEYPEFREALLTAYPWFDEFDRDTNYALQVQWLESQAIIQAMMTVLDHGAGCLSVHESLIVPVGARELAKSAMITAFEDVAGITPVLAGKK